MAKKKAKAKEGGWQGFIVKYQVLLLILVALTAYTILRLHAASLPITEDWAVQRLDAVYRSQGRESEIGSLQYGQELETLRKQYEDIYTDNNGNFYLHGVDSYGFLIQARNIMDGGEADYLLPYLEVYSYKLMSIFSSKATLEKAAYWLPFIFTAFSIILIFFVARKLTNNLGGFFAAFLLAIHPQFFTATQAGFADTNFLNLFFTLLIVLLFVEGIGFRKKGKNIRELAENNIRQLIFLALIIPAAYLFKFSWVGFFYIIFIIILSSISYMIYYLIFSIKKHDSARHKIALAVFIALLLISLFAVKDTGFFTHGMKKVRERIGGFQEGELFPSSAPTTTELLSAPEAQKLKGSSQGPFLYLLDGWVLAILALLSLFFIIKDHYRINERSKYASFILVWFIVMFIAGYRSIRFISFFAIPFCILVSYGLVRITSLFGSLMHSRYRIKRNVSVASAAIILLLAVTLSVSADLSDRSKRIPAITSIIEDAGSRLKQSSPDSIINIWWDKGYLYSYYSERKVSMDNGVGGNPDPRIYWTSKLFMGRDEREALQIMKMLDCSDLPGNPLAHYLVNLSQIECNPPEAFILLDYGLIGKIDIFDYYTKWDFLAESRKPFSQPEINSISAPSSCYPTEDRAHLICGEKFDLDLAAGKLIYKGEEVPFMMVSDEGIFMSEKTGSHTIIIYPVSYGEQSAYNAVFVRTELLDSLFVRLYFMKGIGLEHFEPFAEVAHPVAGRIVIYKVKWD